MVVAKIYVSGTCAQVIAKEPILAGLVGGRIEVIYEAGLWENLTRTVVFRSSATKDVITSERYVEIPPEVLVPGARLWVGFYGTVAGKALPTVWANLGTVVDGTDPSGDTSTDPALPVWAQLANEVDKLKQSGTGGGIAVTGARVGQTVTIAAVDEKGIPTAWQPEDFPDLTGYARSVNGVKPDPETGDVVINIPGSGGNVDLSNYYTKEEVDNLIPASVGGGLSTTAIALLKKILESAVYETDQSGNIALLIDALTNGSTLPDVPEEPDPEEPDSNIISMNVESRGRQYYGNGTSVENSGMCITEVIKLERGATYKLTDLGCIVGAYVLVSLYKASSYDDATNIIVDGASRKTYGCTWSNPAKTYLGINGGYSEYFTFVASDDEYIRFQFQLAEEYSNDINNYLRLERVW